ncbi:MAG: SpoVA/SpoVAEb family sporulation membrane protein [Firmicutes bacterium]|nr:SpoVA/SpoVAEb family sporulation membrane protein [Bacillota bacterium]
MEIFLKFVYAFLVGGAICMIGQILILRTKWTTSRILVIFVTLGVILGAAQVFAPIRKVVGAGITVPIVGFGGVLAEGTIKAVREEGFMGIFMGGLAAAAAGVAAAIVFAFIAAMVSRSRSKK